MASFEELRKTRLEKLERLRALGLDPYPARVNRTHTAAELGDDFEKLEKGKKKVFLVGRIRGSRRHGRASFVDIEDETGRFQIFLEEAGLGKESYKIFSELTDIGDFIEVSGTLFKTQKSEKTLRAETFRIITKALRPIPEEHFGLKDIEARLRRRYLDLILNKETREIFRKKARFWKTARAYLDKHGFLEVDTPALEDVPGGADARPFITHHNALDRDFYLRISLELPLKKVIIGGFEKVYEIGKVFRNEGISAEHLQDYLSCEFYWAYADYEELTIFVENFYKTIIKETLGSLETPHENETIRWGGEWPRIDWADLVREKLNLDLAKLESLESLRTKAKKLGIETEKSWGRGRILDQIWKSLRADIIQPTVLRHHPVEVSPLAKRLPKKPSVVQRIQVVAAGTEIGNGWSELNDPFEQL